MKRPSRFRLLPFLLACAAPLPALAVPMPVRPEADASVLTPALTSSTQIIESALALPDGRLLLLAPRWLGNPAPQLSVVRPGDTTAAPWPDATWNTVDDSAPDSHFVAVTGMTLAADGSVWLVDSGVPDRGNPGTAPARLIHIDPATGQMLKIIPVTSTALRPGSITGGIAVHDKTAYVPDSGAAGLLVTDLETGDTRRFLDHVEALEARRPVQTPEGPLPARDGRPMAIDANLIAVSPDGRQIYLQAYAGPLYRIETSLLGDPETTRTALQESATLWYKTHALGGLTIGPDGTLYWSDVTTGSIDSYTPGRIPHHLITDPRLRWPGGIALAGDTLYVPAAQLNQAARFHNGQSQVQWPVTVYRFKVPSDATSDVLRK